ncbi:MAG: hypothetical protein MJ180_06215 [Candidatus Gastranaerophilales bacterium]|nr:hypothetical protein [Candidatus Gastranaerophilales bacterium]
MTIVNAIFSTLGNNSSLWTIATKDGIETVGRTAMAYKEGSKTSKKFGKLEAREKLIEANATSLIWLGGIPALKVLFDRLYTNKKYNFSQLKDYGKDALAKTDIRLLEENSPQALKLENIKDTNLIPEVKKILNDKKSFKATFIKRSVISTLIPIALVGYILPKTVYAFTHKMIGIQKRKELKKAYHNQQANKGNIINSKPAFATFMGKANRTNLSFHGKLESLSKYFTHPDKNMMMVDGGIWAGRAGSSRNFLEACERTINELGYIFLLYCGGKYVAKGLEALTKKLGKVPTALDAKILQNKEFTDNLVKIAKDSDLSKKAVEFVENNENAIIDLIDKDLAKNGGKFSNLTLQAAQQTGIIDVVKGARNPLKYIETKDISLLNKNLKEFIEALKNSANPEKLINKAKNMKRASILANVAICSFALAYLLPKAQYTFRHMVSDHTIAPGLTKYYEEEQSKKA